ncbi:MAG: recombinase family protein [Pirellulaceae bacterium]|nr:hypothetical protein [Planctomycetota bacterium]
MDTKPTTEELRQRLPQLIEERLRWCRNSGRAQGLEKARQSAAKAHSDAFDAEYSDFFPVVEQLRADGKSYQAIANTLNEQGHTTRRGKLWNRMQVHRLANARHRRG